MDNNNMSFFQQLEQMRELFKDISPLLWGYYRDLKEQGFSDEQAFQLVRDFQRDKM